MLASEIRELKPGARLLFRVPFSIEEDLRAGVIVEVIKVVMRHYGPVLIARWGEDEVEMRLSDYLACLQCVPTATPSNSDPLKESTRR
jgi:hypothetical protein